MTSKVQRNFIIVRKIDPVLYEKLKAHASCVHSIYKSTLNLLCDNSLIAIGTNFSFGRNRIIVKPQNFVTEKSKVFDQLTVNQKGFQIGELFFVILDASFYQIKYKTEIYKLDSSHLDLLLGLLTWLVQQEKMRTICQAKSDSFIKYQLVKIYAFLSEDSQVNAQQLIGLGMGSTPLGDDILLGYLIAKGSIGEMPRWTDFLIDYALNSTTPISYHSFSEAYERAYTEHIHQMLYDFYMHKKSDTLKEWIHYGDTSGTGILLGFIFGLLSKGGIKHAGLEIITQYLL